MKRKIVRQGQATMTISLPASWIKRFHLKEGDELDIEESGNKIEISTEKSRGSDKIELDASKAGKFTKNDLSHLYILGYDEIVIHFNDQETLLQIKDRLPDCIGFEIINQSERSITIKSISSALESEFDNILRKIFIIIKEMGENVHDSLKKQEFSRLKQIREMEAINNKFTSFLLRLLSKRGYKEQNRTLQAYDMIQNLERIADEYKYLCDNYTEHTKKINKDALDLLEEINNYFNLLSEMYFKYDSEKKNVFYSKRKGLQARAYELLKDNDPILVHNLLCLIEKIYNTSGSFFAMIYP